MVAPGHWNIAHLPIMWNAEVPWAGIEAGVVGREQLYWVQALLVKSSCMGWKAWVQASQDYLWLWDSSTFAKQTIMQGSQHACAVLYICSWQREGTACPRVLPQGQNVHEILILGPARSWCVCLQCDFTRLLYQSVLNRYGRRRCKNISPSPTCVSMQQAW